jgi:nucleotide-binding universal stress UspA family protein
MLWPMFRNVIVGVVDGQGGRDAIALAGQLVDPDGLLTLAHVYSHELRVPGRSAADADEAKRQNAVRLLERAREQAGVDARLRPFLASSPGQGLHLLAQDIRADLLVVGSSSDGVLGRVLLADDTHHALNGAPCAVAIAPAGYAQHPAEIREIGVGYNDSSESQNAIRFARELARRYDADVSAFGAVSLPSYTFIGGPVPLEGVDLQEMVDAARARIAALGVEAHAAYGITSEELSLYSESVDLLILGSREYGPVGQLVHGSTSQELAGSARCPLLVLPRAGGGAAAARSPSAGARAAQELLAASGWDPLPAGRLGVRKRHLDRDTTGWCARASITSCSIVRL